MVAICEVHGGYHHYSVPLEDNPYGRRCECGSPQRYKPSAGKPAVFTDVLVEADDLRALIDWVEGPDYDPHGDFDRLMERINSALD